MVRLPPRSSCRGALAGLIAWLGLGCGGDDGGGGGARAPASRDVAAVIKNVDNPFFTTMSDGLVLTARRTDGRLHLDTAAGLQDTAGQASALESLVGRRAGCYVVNPVTPTNLIPPLAHLPSRTPIVNIDSPLDRRAASAVGVAITTYVGTDNVAAGRRAAAAMVALVGRGARVAAIAGIPGDFGSGQRIRGFRAGARGRLKVAPAVAADFDRQRARVAAEELLRADPRLRGLFAVNDEMALGIVDAVRAVGRHGRVAVIGMDGTRQALRSIQRGALSATVAQYPFEIGRLAVEACQLALRGKRVPAQIDAPVQVVTRGNVARALAKFPEPVTPLRDPLAGLLGP